MKNRVKLVITATVLSVAVMFTGCQKKSDKVSSTESVVTVSQAKANSGNLNKTKISDEKTTEVLKNKALEQNKQEAKENETKTILAKEANTEQPVVEIEDKKGTAESNAQAAQQKVGKETNATTAAANNKAETKTPAEETKTPAQEAPAEDPVAKAQAIVNSTHDNASRIIALTNLYRAQNGLGSLVNDSTLSAIAQTRAEEIITCWSHTRPDGTNATALAAEYGLSYSVLGENLGEYQTSADQVCTDWMNSPGHRANMLGGSYGRIGIGIATDESGYIYWVQIFAD